MKNGNLHICSSQNIPTKPNLNRSTSNLVAYMVQYAQYKALSMAED